MHAHMHTSYIAQYLSSIIFCPRWNVLATPVHHSIPKYPLQIIVTYNSLCPVSIAGIFALIALHTGYH